jgi:hypothetical protein
MPGSTTGEKIFGAGRFFGTNGVTSPTPTAFLVPQDQSIDFKQATKSLYGELKLPVEVAAGELTVSGKITMGTNNARMFSDLLFNVAGVTGQISESNLEGPSVIPSTPFQVTVVNGATFLSDLGVNDPASGLRYTLVASGPTTGQYSLNAVTGVYTFAAADAGKSVVISYLYTVASTGEKIAVANTLMGPAGSFQAAMVFTNGSSQDVLILNNAISEGVSIATKQGDFAKPVFSFMASTDGSNNLGTFSFAQAA